MKHVKFSGCLALTVLLFACSNEPAKEEGSSADSAKAAASQAVPAKPAFSPFAVAGIVTKVKNFDKWVKLYEADDSIRKAYGLSSISIARDNKDSNKIYLLNRIEDMDKTRAYAKLTTLKELGKDAGVVTAPDYSYGQVIRVNDSPVATTQRLGVAHHVKDFSAWLKVFDGEGAATRAANGIIDMTLARSLVDSNMVYLTFAITDSARASARMHSPELKKIMEGAGVDSPPTMRWYRMVKQ